MKETSHKKFTWFNDLPKSTRNKYLAYVRLLAFGQVVVFLWEFVIFWRNELKYPIAVGANYVSFWSDTIRIC